MAGLLIGGTVFAIGKVREKRAEKKAKRKHNADRYAELERETLRGETVQDAEKAFAPPQGPSSQATGTEEKRRGSSESEREGGEVIREVEARLRSASLTSPTKAPAKIQRKSTGEMLFGDGPGKGPGG